MSVGVSVSCSNGSHTSTGEQESNLLPVLMLTRLCLAQEVIVLEHLNVFKANGFEFEIPPHLKEELERGPRGEREGREWEKEDGPCSLESARDRSGNLLLCAILPSHSSIYRRTNVWERGGGQRSRHTDTHKEADAQGRALPLLCQRITRPLPLCYR